MTIKLTTLMDRLRLVFTSDEMTSLTLAHEEVTLEVLPCRWLKTAYQLRDQLQFESCVDVCGVDYSTYKAGTREGPRFAVVYHLLSLVNNVRLRVRVSCLDDSKPSAPSVVGVWPGVNWFEREAFDLFGILFEGHPDLRRILTDYDFEGYPFRKDFPISGYVEMIYDEKEGRVLYQPVTIMPREVMPRCYPKNAE